MFLKYICEWGKTLRSILWKILFFPLFEFINYIKSLSNTISNFILCCVCVYLVCAHICVCALGEVRVEVWCQVSSQIALHSFIFLRQFLTLNLANWLDWLASKPLESPSLCLPSTKRTGMYHIQFFFTRILGIQVLSLFSKHITNQVNSSAPSSNVNSPNETYEVNLKSYIKHQYLSRVNITIEIHVGVIPWY